MNEKTKKFINLKSITIAAVLIALLAIGSAIAFFTDKDNKTNDFTEEIYLFSLLSQTGMRIMVKT